MADDPDLQVGRKILSGGGASSAPSSSAATTDPDLQAGRDVLAATPASTASKDASSTSSTSTPYDVEHSWLGIPAIHNFAAGVTQGAKGVVATGANVANWVDKRVPALAWLDRNTIGDMGDAANALDTSRRAYEASPEGQSYTGGAGRIVGGIAATLPLTAGVGALAGGATRLGATALDEAAPWLSRAITGAGDFVSGTAAAPQAGVVPNLLVRGGSLAAQGGIQGAEYGGLTSGGSDKSAAENALEMGEAGAALGPAGAIAGKVAGATSRGAVGAFDYLTGRSVGKQIEAAMADARARAGSIEVPPEEPPPPPGVAPPTAGGGASPGPTAAGADITSQASLDANALTRRQEIAGKVDRIDQMLRDQPNVGTADFTEYVKGNLPTQAEGLGDAHLASVQRQVEPGSQAFTNKRDLAIKNRIDHFENRAGTATMLDNAETELADWDKQTLAPVWAKKTPVDASAVLSDVDARLASPEAQIGPVEAALNEVRSRLFKRGTDELHDDPQMLYGARRQISFMLSKKGRLANPAYGDDDVMRELIGVRDQLDKAIEPGAPGFGAWRAGHEAQMGDINRMEVLQGIRQNILGQNGDIQLSRLTSALKGLRTKMAQGGANPVHSLNLDDLEMLSDLNKDLLREGNKSLSMPLNSATAHNLDVGAQMGLNAATAGAHYLAAHIPGANALLDTGLTKRAMANSAKTKLLWERNLLQPPNLPPP